jgi:tetratricopeptide (TPR) repeat protein
MTRFEDKIQQLQISMYAGWIRNQGRAGLVVFLLLFAGFIWIIITNPELKVDFRSAAFVILWVGGLFLLIWLLVWRWQQRNSLTVLPFQNLTGDPSYDGMAAGFPALLTAEIHRILGLQTQVQWLGHRRQAPAFTRLREKSLPHSLSEATLSRTADISGGEIGDQLENIGTAGFGPVKIPLGGLLNLAMRILKPGVILGSLLKHGDTLTVLVSLKAPKRPSYKWIVNGKSDKDMTAVNELVVELAYRMIIDTNPSISAQSWQSFRALSNGLDHYQLFLLSNITGRQGLEEARRNYQVALALEPTFALAHHNLGVIYEEKGMDEAALEAYRLALALDPQLAPAYNSIGLLYLTHGQMPEAIEAFEQAAQLYPNRPRFKQDLAYALFEKAKSMIDRGGEEIEITRLLERAIYYYRSAIDGYRKANAIRTAKETAEQGWLSNKASRWFKDNEASAWRYLGFALLRLLEYRGQLQAKPKERARDLKEAKAAFMKAIEINDLDGHSHLALGQINNRLGDYQKAFVHYHKALAIDPYSIDAHLELGQVYLDHGQKLYRNLKEQDSEALSISQLLLLLDQEQYVRRLAEAEFRKAVEIAFDTWEDYSEESDETRHLSPPGNWAWLKQLAIAVYGEDFFQGGEIETLSFDDLSVPEGADEPAALPDTEQSETSLRMILRVLYWAMSLNPELDEVHMGLAVIWREERRNEAAFAHYKLRNLCLERFEDREGLRRELHSLVEMSSEDDSSRDIYLSTLGWLYRREGNLAEAISCLEYAGHNGTFDWQEYPQVQYELGLLYSHVEDYEKAIEAFQKADDYFEPEEKEDHLRNLLRLGDACYLAQKYDESIRAYSNAFLLTGQNVPKKAQSLASRGVVFQTQQKYAYAIRDYAEAIRLVPPYTFARVALCEIFVASKDYERAFFEAQSAIEFDPNYAPTHRVMGDAASGLAESSTDKTEKESWLVEATVAYRQAIALWPPEDVENKAVVLIKIGSLYMSRKMYSEAVRAYEEAVTLVEEPAYYLELGSAYADSRSFLKAKEFLQKAIELGKGRVAEEKNEDERKELEMTVASAQNLLAYIFAELAVQSGFKKAFELVNDALKIASGDEDKAAFLDTRGWLYFQQGKYDEAIADLEQSLYHDLGSTTAETVYHLALAYEAKGFRCNDEREKEQCFELARLRWKQVLKLDPEGDWAPEARERLGEIHLPDEEGLETP